MIQYSFSWKEKKNRQGCRHCSKCSKTSLDLEYFTFLFSYVLRLNMEKYDRYYSHQDSLALFFIVNSYAPVLKCWKGKIKKVHYRYSLNELVHKVNTHRHEEGPVFKPAVQQKKNTRWVWASPLNDHASGLLSARACQPTWWMSFICIWVMKKNKDRGVFLLCDWACRHASPCRSLFLVLMSIFSQIDEFAKAV